MKALIISDKDYQTKEYEGIDSLLCSYLSEKGFETEEKCIGRDELAYCMGCFGCWTKKPGECVINDGIAELNRREMNSDLVIFLTPVVFGQFSANIKNAVDRWLPNMLPFFETRKDGSTMHPPRYDDYPKQMMIGYGAELSERDAQLFTDITKKHRSSVEALIWRGDSENMIEALKKIEIKRVSGTL